jgi:hypothetical protein
MATVKISQLPVLSQLSANNANTVFVVVDRTTNTTSQFSTTVLAQGLYANNILNVGTANTGLLLPNSVAQFISNTEVFSQVNFQNLNPKGSADIVITSDDGDNSNNYLDLGVQGSNMDADSTFDLPNNDGYLYMHGTAGERQGNLWIGTATSNTDVVFFTGAHKQANEIGRFENGVGLSLKMPIKFADSTIQNTAAVTAAHSQVIFNQANSAYEFAINVNTYAASIYTLANTQSNSISVIQGVDTTQNTNITTANNQAWAAFDAANTNSSNIAILQAVNTTQNTNITTANNHAWAAFDKANNALANTTGIFDGTLTITGDLEFDGTASIQSTDDMFIGSNSGIQIQTDNGGTQKQFQFGIDGNLSVPNYIVFPDNTEIGYNASASPATFMVSTSNTFTVQANGKQFNFGTDGSLTLSQGSIISETTTTTTISPPGALAGQSLVIRPTSTGIISDHPSGFVSGDTITITVVPNNYNPANGSVDYTFTECTAEQLGRALTGTLTANNESMIALSWTVPISSDITTFTFTLSNPTGEFEGLSNSFITLTGTGSSETSHIHLVAGDSANTDIYLGDDDQYIKIEKNNGDVVIATNTNIHLWRFGTDGNLTFPDNSTQTGASISIAELKVIVANTSNYGDFQSAIAAL